MGALSLHGVLASISDDKGTVVQDETLGMAPRKVRDWSGGDTGREAWLVDCVRVDRDEMQNNKDSSRRRALHIVYVPATDSEEMQSQRHQLWDKHRLGGSRTPSVAQPWPRANEGAGGPNIVLWY